MGAKFVNIDRDTPMIFPPDLHDWLPENSMVHFVVDAVEMLELKDFSINHRGSGSDQYPPSMMLALLIYTPYKVVCPSVDALIVNNFL